MRKFIFISLIALLLTGCTEPSIVSTVQVTKEENMVDIDGQTIYFKKIGRDKPPLLLLHGYGGSSDGFQKIYPALSKQFTIVSVDILGFGRSSKPLDFYYSFPNQANLYYKLMTKLGYTNFSVLGHSMGGEIALNLSYLYPQVINKLVLVDATGVESIASGQGGPKPKLDSSLTNVGPVLPYDKKSVKNNREDTKHYEGLHMQWPRRLQIEAAQLQMPKLVIWGRKDRSVPWQNGETFKNLLPNSSLHIIEEGEHAPFRQQPEEFMKYVTAFLTNATFDLSAKTGG